jgi:hypothetical protein
MDATIWLLIIIGVLIGAFLYIKSDKHRTQPAMYLNET